MIDNEYILRDEITEDVTLNVRDEIQPQLNALYYSFSLICTTLAQVVGDVEEIKAKLDGKSEKEIKEIKAVSEDLKNRFNNLSHMFL